MPQLVHQRCFTHAHREAAARCPECKRFFCRECITEHEDRVLCAACLEQLAGAKEKRRRIWRFWGRGGLCLVGVFTVWLAFYFCARALLLIPDSFHEGTIWEYRGPFS